MIWTLEDEEASEFQHPQAHPSNPIHAYIVTEVKTANYRSCRGVWERVLDQGGQHWVLRSGGR